MRTTCGTGLTTSEQRENGVCERAGCQRPPMRLGTVVPDHADGLLFASLFSFFLDAFHRRCFWLYTPLPSYAGFPSAHRRLNTLGVRLPEHSYFFTA